MTGRTEITLFAGSDTGAQSTGNIDASSATAPESDAMPASSSPAYSIVELTAAYSPQNSSRIERGFAFSTGYEHLFIVDEFKFAPSSSVENVTWSMHTMATIKLGTGVAQGGDGDGLGSAVLSLGGVSLHATVIEPVGATFSSMAVNLQPPFKPSVGVSKLLVVLPLSTQSSEPLQQGVTPGAKSAAAAGAERIVVRLSLSPSATQAKIHPLAQWKSDGPFASSM